MATSSIAHCQAGAVLSIQRIAGEPGSRLQAGQPSTRSADRLALRRNNFQAVRCPPLASTWSRRALLHAAPLAVVSSASSAGRRDPRASAVETAVSYEFSSLTVSVTTQEPAAPSPARGPPAFVTATGRIIASECILLLDKGRNLPTHSQDSS